MYHKRGIWAIKAKHGGFSVVTIPSPSPSPSPKLRPRSPPSFTTPMMSRRPSASITPGTVLILLAGRFRGKRVVFLKQLPSGLLLVTGVIVLLVINNYLTDMSSYAPLRSMEFLEEGTLARKAKKNKTKGEGEFFEAEKEKNVLPQEKKDDQKTVDTALLKAIESVPDLKSYLGARFSLTAGMKPHELVF
ncbi:hypothetical protein Fmac_032703 [Flemingia macrophylla]|uniref:60S ribosomal protein L6 n=1 Tax=Flemingia macrophylla TaxID=520843 RepID=A0ABD1L5N7_9FABA